MAPRRPWAAPVAVVALAVPLAVVVTALLPAGLVAETDVDPDAAVADVVETPFALVPAAAQPVADRVSYGELSDDVITDTELDGKIFFLTISEPSQSLLSYWVGVDEPEIQFITYRQKYGDSTPAEYKEVSLQMMRSSNQSAQFVALERAGYDVEVVPGPPQVEFFYCFDEQCEQRVPAAEQLQRADIIRAVDGVAVADHDELDAVLNDPARGPTVDLDITRTALVADGASDAELARACARVDDGDAAPDAVERQVDCAIDDVQLVTDTAGVRSLGFERFDNDAISLPFEIRIDTDEIGGPSAGLAFALTLLDELTGGDLLDGHDVAVTGTIEVDGSVGPIGGVVQKAAVVRQAGLDYFIVPAGQGDEEIARVREVVGDDVTVIVVDDIDDALVALREIGGDAPEVLVAA